MTRYEHQDAVARELEQLAGARSYGKRRRSLKMKALRFGRCGRRTLVEQCGDCGKKVPGTGVQKASDFPCQLRICGLCQRRAAAKRVNELLASVLVAVDALPPESTEFDLREFTLTTWYDPTDPNELTCEAIRERVVSLNRAAQHIWNKGGLRDARTRDKRRQRRKGTGLECDIEMGTLGMVHLHAVYLGPYVDHEHLRNVAREVDPRIDLGKRSYVRLVERDELSPESDAAIRQVFGGRANPGLCASWFGESLLGELRLRPERVRRSLKTEAQIKWLSRPRSMAYLRSKGREARALVAKSGHRVALRRDDLHGKLREVAKYICKVCRHWRSAGSLKPGR